MVIQPYCMHPYSLYSASSDLLHSDSVQTISSWSFNPIAFSLYSASSTLLHSDSVQTISSWSFNPIAFTHTALTVLVSFIAFRLSTDYFLMVIQSYCMHPYSLYSSSSDLLHSDSVQTISSWSFNPIAFTHTAFTVLAQIYCTQTQYRLFPHGHSTLLHAPIQPLQC